VLETMHGNSVLIARVAFPDLTQHNKILLRICYRPIECDCIVIYSALSSW